MTQKPVLRLIHHLARSGGTVICKCLGSMSDIALLSEIHPYGLEYFSPLEQAKDWYGFFTEQEIEELKKTGITFNKIIYLINDKASEKGKQLVIRDWTHLDYLGIPFVEEPSYTLKLPETLEKTFNLKRFCTVRHPIHQFVSTLRLRAISQHPNMSVRFFMKGYLEFAKQAVNIGYIKYEDFCNNPDHYLKKICTSIDISFDDNYRNKWYKYNTITGDSNKNRNAADALQSKTIKAMIEKEIPEKCIP